MNEPNVRLIDGNSLCEMFVKNQPEWWHHSAVWAVICATHTIDAEPVKHGRWEEIEDFDGESHWRCSACGEEWWFEIGGPVENGSNYCPNCGAKMDLEEEQP